MALGRSHDRVTCWLATPYGLLWGLGQGPAAGLCAGLAFLLGGLWLSPDLDTISRPTRRWGPLQPLWWPYRRLLPHRSPLSHGPLLGSAGRLLYLCLLLAGLSLLASPLGTPSPQALLGLAMTLWMQHRPLVLAVLIGVEASAWLHLIQDGDPLLLPRRPRRSRGRRRRRN